MNKTFPQKESDMYPIIKDFFLKSCDKVFVDGLRLRKNLRIGRVDVTALENPDGVASQIHLIEAKSFAKRQSFEECEPAPLSRTPRLWRDTCPERSPGWPHDTRQSSASGRWS
jgi:hypothetical protein